MFFAAINYELSLTSFRMATDCPRNGRYSFKFKNYTPDWLLGTVLKKFSNLMEIKYLIFFFTIYFLLTSTKLDLSLKEIKKLNIN